MQLFLGEFMTKKLLGLLFIFSLTQQSFAGSQSYEEFLGTLKGTADRVAIQAQEARESVRHGITAYESFPDAVKQAEKFGAAQVKPLTVIAPDNPNITWDANKTHVLMVSWMPEATAERFYKPYLGKEFNVVRDMWVTVSPEIKNFIKTYKGSTPLHFRLQQLMGLPIKEGNNVFVESWVKPSDLIRPCINKEVTDRECEVDTAPKKPVDAGHKKWFMDEKSGKYVGQWQFPWTRLGYTYDTGKPTSPEKFGLSEFVILPGRKIQVKSIIPTQQYIQ